MNNQHDKNARNEGIYSPRFMYAAIEKAEIGVKAGAGGPFGAVVVNAETGEVIACEHNAVLATNDPTMHAEVAAIRAACEKLGRFSLHDCVIYSTCMPCPMCLGAIMWAKIPTLFYGATAVDAASIGFDDDYIYSFIKGGLVDGKLAVESVDETLKADCMKLFDDWRGSMY